jgi:hypothetical protein
MGLHTGRPSSIEPAFSIRVGEHPFHAQRGVEFLGLLTSVEGGKPKVAGQACCSDKGGQQVYARTYAQILGMVLILVGLVSLALGLRPLSLGRVLPEECRTEAL